MKLTTDSSFNLGGANIESYFYRLSTRKTELQYSARNFFQEPHLKQTLFALSLALASTLAHADLAEKFQANCATPENVTLQGATGSCRIVVAPKKIEKRGVCVGTFMGSLPCVVSYISVKEGAAMNLTCGTDPKAPVIDQDMAAEAVGFNVATLIKKADGQDVVQNDKNEYSEISSNMVSVSLTQTPAGTTGAVTLQLQMGPVALQNVTCN